LLPYRAGVGSIDAYLDRLDGILLSGGDDIDPSIYGETWHERAVRIDPARQGFELALLAAVERRGVPALGVCLGFQMMNVYRGGSLHQFLPDVPRPDAIEHRKVDGVMPRHDVTIEPGSLLHETIGRTQCLANTAHKQAVNRMGRGLKITARAADGVIEGFEDPTLPLFLGVQWHPERLHDEPEHLALFQLLVKRAAEYASRRR
jgi:putative glutamine amidotransferase